MLRQHQKGYIDDKELDEKMEEVLVKKSQLEEEKTRCERVLNDREDVREAVEKAVIYVQDQVDLIEVLERYDGSPKTAEQVKERLEIVDEVYLSESKVKELVNRLKRSALQRFVNPKLGIRVVDRYKFTINGVAGEAIIDTNKSLKRTYGLSPK
ncbi:MAG: hypothetical protein JSU78_05250 [Deltaproteobacteria bacterium]|nr:MAG: hypothetical protein JSU78_05250 [Deltaproteobacteria bacterium]